MSFVLRFFHAPHATTVRDAIAWADGPHPAPRGRNPHFARFLESISEFYPDLSGDDEDGESRNLWPEGLESDEGDGDVVNILINTDMLDEGVMSVIAQHAAKAGLQVLDEQNGLLFGPGLQCIGMQDAAPAPLPPISDFAYSVMTENVRGLRLDHARREIADACHRALGDGFTRAEGRWSSVVRRDHGELRQMLSVRVIRSSDGRNARAYCRLGFACEKLAHSWMPLLPQAYVKRRANYDAAAGGTDLEFACFVPDLASGELPTALSMATSSLMPFADASEMDKLIGGAEAWTSDTLKPFLDQLRSVDGLLPLFIHEASLRHARVGPMAFPEYPAMLALARYAGMQELDAYEKAYRANPNLRRICTLFKDPTGADFEALVEGLRKSSAIAG